MNLTKIGELAVTFDWHERYDQDDWTDKHSELERASDVVVVTLEDGTKQFRAEANHLGGLCDCCRESKNPKLFEFFKQII